ncbi:MAG: sulfurtransferase TusA family protein [Halothiobacillus sp.]
MDVIDARGLRCPLPLLRARKALAGMEVDARIQIWATDLGAPADFKAYCAQTGHALIGIEQENEIPMFLKITLARGL